MAYAPQNNPMGAFRKELAAFDNLIKNVKEDIDATALQLEKNGNDSELKKKLKSRKGFYDAMVQYREECKELAETTPEVIHEREKFENNWPHLHWLLTNVGEVASRVKKGGGINEKGLDLLVEFWKAIQEIKLAYVKGLLGNEALAHEIKVINPLTSNVRALTSHHSRSNKPDNKGSPDQNNSGRIHHDEGHLKGDLDKGKPDGPNKTTHRGPSSRGKV